MSTRERRRSRPCGVAWVARFCVALAGALLPSPSGAACEATRLDLEAPTAVVFTGGGARGAWEAGVAARLLEGAVRIRAVAGTSTGALTGALLADGRREQLEAAWAQVTPELVYSVRAPVVAAVVLPGWLGYLTLARSRALLDPDPLRALIATRVDLDRVRTSPVTLLVVVTDLARRTRLVFDNRSVTAEVLLGAVSLPGVFPPVAVGGAHLVDGGLTGRVPVDELLVRAPEVRRVVVTAGYAQAASDTPPRTVRRALEEAFETTLTHQILAETELGRLRHPGVEIHLLTPSVPLTLRPLDLEPERLQEALRQGRRDAAACLERWGTPAASPSARRP